MHLIFSYYQHIRLVWKDVPALLEAMSTGLPVIASNIPGSRDILEDFQDYLFEPEIMKLYQKKLNPFYSDKYQTVLGNSMRNHIEKNLILGMK